MAIHSTSHRLIKWRNNSHHVTWAEDKRMEPQSTCGSKRKQARKEAPRVWVTSITATQTHSSHLLRRLYCLPYWTLDSQKCIQKQPRVWIPMFSMLFCKWTQQKLTAVGVGEPMRSVTEPCLSFLKENTGDFLLGTRIEKAKHCHPRGEKSALEGTAWRTLQASQAHSSSKT